MTPTKSRRLRAVVLGAAIVLGGHGTARPESRRGRAPSGEAIRAARLLAASRVDEARGVIAELHRQAPGTDEVEWLSAQLAFVDGDYPRAVEQLAAVADDASDPALGELKRLYTRTRDLTAGFVHRDSPGGHFTFYYPPGPDEVIVDLAGDVLDAAWQAVGDDLGYKPSRKLRVELLSSPRDLAQLSTLTEDEIETTGTIALSKYEKLMVVSPRATLLGYPWMDTLVHEYTHFVISRVSHNTVPVWLHEGLARFEQARWRAAPSTQLPAPDQQLLAGALARRRLIDLDQMHPSMAKLPSQEAAALAYAEVFTLVGWMHEKVGYAGLRQILAAQQNGKSARRAVAEVMGTTWTDVEKDWKGYLRTLNLSGGRAIGGRNPKPVRFDKGGGSNENVGLDGVQSPKARKFARIGGMLRARGLAAAAALEYEKALAAAGGSDPYLAGKLARTYVELGRHDKAINLARPLVILDEHDAVAAVTLGIALAANRDFAGARDAFERALRVSPFDPTVRCGLARAYAELGDAVRAPREQAACDRLRS